MLAPRLLEGMIKLLLLTIGDNPSMRAVLVPGYWCGDVPDVINLHPSPRFRSTNQDRKRGLGCRLKDYRRIIANSEKSLYEYQ